MWKSTIFLLLSVSYCVNGFRTAIFKFPFDWRKIESLNPFPFNVNTQLSSMLNIKSIWNRLDTVENKSKKPKKVLLARVVAWALRRIVRNNSEDISGLEINVQDTKNYEILRGNVKTIEMIFDKIAFGQLYVSGGGRIMIKDLQLRLRRFLFRNKQSIRKPYAIYCDLLLTQEDIAKSELILSWIQQLADTLLGKALGPSSIFDVTVQKVLLRSRRIVVRGLVCVRGNNKNIKVEGARCIPFEVSTGAKMIEEGQTLHLKSIKVVLNPDKVLLRTEVPILTTTPIDIDLGENCRIDSLVISDQNIWLRAASAISPVIPFTVAETKSKAFYHYDLSALLSQILWLNGGIATRWIK